MNKKIKGSILMSLGIVAFAGTIVAGTTYALFTSEDKADIAVTAGKVNVSAEISDLVTFSGEANSLTGDVTADSEHIVATSVNGTFTNDGTATVNEDKDTLTLSNVTPGDKVTFNLNLANNSTVAIKYRTVVTCESDTGLFDALTFTIGNDSFTGLTKKSNWDILGLNDTITSPLACSVALPSSAGNIYQETSCTISYKVEAVQGNAATTNPDTDTIEIYTVSDLKWVQKHNSEIDSTKTVKLMNNLDLTGINWTPIGNDTSKPFVATFDGNGKTISNLTTNNYSYIKDSVHGMGTGLFGYVKNATIKNFTVVGANVGGVTAADGETYIYSEVGVIAGCTYENSTFDSITVKDSTVKAQTKVGAIVGQSITPGSTTKITNCSIKNVTVSGNYSYALVCGLINNVASSINLAGTTVDTDSKAEFWTSSACEFTGGEGKSFYTETYDGGSTTYKWELNSGKFWIIEVGNAWAVQRGNYPEITSNAGESGSGTLVETIVYLDNSDYTRTFPKRYD